MSASARVRLYVGVAALAAAGATAGVVLATRQTPTQPKSECSTLPHPLVVGGVRSANVAAVRAAFALPTARAAEALQQLAQRTPRDAVVQFNYGVAAFCAGYVNEAADAFHAAKTAGRDTYYEMRADALLHPQYFQSADQPYPPLVLQSRLPLLIQGAIAQRAGHQHTAERLWARAARLYPDDAEAQVAAAVGRFDEDDLSASFSRLGPLVKRFPQSQTVRFHLGLLLVWTGQSRLALQEFRAAVRLGPETSLGKQAKQFVDRIPNGTPGQSK